MKIVDCGLRSFVGPDDFAFVKDAEVTLLVEEGKKLRGLGLRWDGNGECDVNGLTGEVFDGPFCCGLGRVRLDDFARVRIVSGGEAREEQLEVIIDFRKGADGGTGGTDMVLLLNGNGGRDPFDGIHLGFVHAVEKLAHVGREGLHITTLALGIEGMESQ